MSEELVTGLVVGFNFRNKGAELMLRSLSGALRNEPIQFCAKPSTGSFKQRAASGLYQFIDSQRMLGIPRSMLTCIPGSLRESLGLVIEREIDVIFDISGFALTDHWGSEYPRNLAIQTERWKTSGKKVIFLPQGFGPFAKEETRGNVRRICRNSSLLCARDQQSYEWLEKTGCDMARVRKFPDFTGPSQLEERENTPNPTSGLVYIVPNYRLIDKGEKKLEEAAYIEFLKNIHGYLSSRGLDPKILIHDEDDSNDLPTLRAAFGSGEIVEERDPSACKSLIRQARFVIGSRYHALIGALSQRVPAIGGGWAHKYVELFEDYGVGELFIEDFVNLEAVCGRVDLLLEEVTYRRVCERLEASNVRLNSEVSSMWGLVKNLVFDGG